MAFDYKIYDCYANLTSQDRYKGHRSNVADLFKADERLAQGNSLESLLAEMDECGVEKALLSAGTLDPFVDYVYKRDNPSNLEYVLQVAEKYPERFSVVLRVQPREGMEAVRKLDYLVKNHGVVAAKIAALNTLLPYNDKVYYPIYAKCCELGIPVCANVGFPAPRVPSEPQNPIYFDEVCWFFPELKIIMTHMGDPWIDTVVKLLLKWPNIYMMTSAYAPKYYPQQLIQYMNTRGSDKVIFATDWPLLGLRRCVDELKQLPLRDHVWPKFLKENAARVIDWNIPAKSGAPYE